MMNDVPFFFFLAKFKQYYFRIYVYWERKTRETLRGLEKVVETLAYLQHFSAFSKILRAFLQQELSFFYFKSATDAPISVS